MSKMRKLLAAVLVASMLLGSNGITYAAEAAGTDDTVSAVEVVEEAAEKESNQAADAELPDEREEAAAPDASSEKSGDEEAPAEEEEKVEEEAPAEKLDLSSLSEAEQAAVREFSEKIDMWTVTEWSLRSLATITPSVPFLLASVMGSPGITWILALCS